MTTTASHDMKSQQGRPSTQHEYGRTVLDDIALLTGCTESMGNELPDGRRPDVLRLNIAHRMMFIGDAKHSESPSCLATQARLLGYFCWAKAFATCGGALVFAICFSRVSDSQGWLSLLCKLCDEVGLSAACARSESIECGLHLAWIVIR